MAKCECCLEREADEQVDGYAHPGYDGEGLRGAWFARFCAGHSADSIRAMNHRIRARRAAAAGDIAIGLDGAPLTTSGAAEICVAILERLKPAAQSRCPITSGYSVCCHPAGHAGHHESAAGGNRFGWLERLPGEIQTIVAICSADTPAVIAENIARQQRQQRAPKFYGIQPAVLPETLPVGTRCFGADVAISELRLVESRYLGTWKSERCASYKGAAHPSVIDWTAVPIQEDADVTPVRTQEEANAAWGEGSALAAVVGAIIAPNEPVTCRDCSSPATVGKRCAYCDARDSRDDHETLMTMYQRPGESRAYWRMRAAERRDAPRSTASSRELAAGHPASWPSCEGEEP